MKSMKDLNDYIDSGVIMSYVLGLSTPEEIAEVEALSAKYPEINEAINETNDLLEKQALKNAIAPPLTVKPELLATIDYMERLGRGEEMTFPPELNNDRTIADYEQWLNRPDMQPTQDFDGIYVKLIGYTPTCTTAIAWIKEMAPEEVHDKEYERFLIVEGSCTIHVGSTDYKLVPGNYLQIPLYEKHHVVITSTKPCKIILQRVAA